MYQLSNVNNFFLERQQLHLQLIRNTFTIVENKFNRTPQQLVGNQIYIFPGNFSFSGTGREAPAAAQCTVHHEHFFQHRYLHIYTWCRYSFG